MEKHQPTVVIGLGGTGKNILLALKKMIIENSPNGMKDYPLLKLLSLDTDTNVSTITSEIKTIEDEIRLDENTEIVRLRPEGIVGTLKLDDFPQIKDWYPGSLGEKLNAVALIHGAHQIKPVGRFAFAWNASTLREKFYDLLSVIMNADTAKQNRIGENNFQPFTNVFICGSICGGTGSGTFLDVANLVRFVAKEATVVVKIYGLLALASVYDSISGDLKLKPNCYASLVELDHFQNEKNFKSSKRCFYPAYRNIGTEDWNYTNSSNTYAFDYPYLFDKTNEVGVTLSPKQFAEMAARYIYIMTGTDAARQWNESASDNRWNNLSEDSKLHKPIRYASAGVTSIVYPRRKITQLCSYRLADDYFKYILDSSYGSVEIDKIVVRFLNDSKTNPDGNVVSLLAESFSSFKDSDTNIDYMFREYLNSAKESKLAEMSGNIKESKNTILELVRYWTEDLDKKFASFKTQSTVYPRDLKQKFVMDLHSKISDMLNLRLVEDPENPLKESKRFVRGSVVRTKAFLEKLLAKYETANEEFRKIEDGSKTQRKEMEEIYEGKLSALKSAVSTILPNTKNIQKCLEETLTSYENLVNERANEHVAKLIRQWFTEIQENGIHLSDGILKDITDRILNTGSTISKFRNLQEECRGFLGTNKSETIGEFNIEIFNYEKDVEGIYKDLMSNKEFGENEVLESLSNRLQSDDMFGSDYARCGTALVGSRIQKMLLTETEKFFIEPVGKVNIRDRLLEDKEKLDSLTSGAALATAKIYIRLDGQEMSASSLNTKGKTCYAITIPNEPEYKDCSSFTKAVLGKPFVCPKEKSKEVCGIYGKCLKAMILANARASEPDALLEVIPSEENGEINIIKEVVGFPLRAISTVSGPYREEYRKEVKKQEERNEYARLYDGKEEAEECLHMFGTVKFTDLGEPDEGLLEMRKQFRKALLVTLIARRLVVDSFGVQFFTQYDMDRKSESPSLFLGKDFSEVVFIAESNRIKDIRNVEEIKTTSSELLKLFVKNKDKGLEETKRAYQEIKNPHLGFSDEDDNMLREISWECFGCDCKPNTNPTPLHRWEN